MKIWLDDVRTPPDDSWLWCKDADDFLDVLITDVVIREISFDHDIASYDPFGTEITGYTCLCWIEKRAMNDRSFPVPKMSVHSANPVGRKRMQLVIDKLHAIREREGG